MAAETKTVVHKNGEPLKIILQRCKEGHSWEIHVQGSTLAEIMPQLLAANIALKREFGGKK